MESWTPAITDESVNENLRSIVSRLKRASNLPVVFAGTVCPRANDVRIDYVAGGMTNSLAGLRVAAGNGLGGRVVATSKPHYVSDYLSDKRISHEYDGPVAAEGLRAIAAAPLVVNDAVLAVVYTGLRGGSPSGHRLLDTLQRAVTRAGIDLAVRVELDRRYAELRTQVARISERDALGRSRDSMTMRGVYEELRSLTEQVESDELRKRFTEACERLRGEAPRSEGSIALSPRELDVINLIAVGCSNKEVGGRLGLTTETVKSYLRSASRKLGTHNRTETVSCARRAGLVP